jgi:hypothetical protein
MHWFYDPLVLQTYKKIHKITFLVLHVNFSSPISATGEIPLYVSAANIEVIPPRVPVIAVGPVFLVVPCSFHGVLASWLSSHFSLLDVPIHSIPFIPSPSNRTYINSMVVPTVFSKLPIH